MEQNPRFEKSNLKVELTTHAYWYVFANMPVINEVTEFFNDEDPAETNSGLEYYKDQAKIKALEYMNMGSEYMENVNNTEQTDYVHQSFDVTVNLYAPVLFVPEDLNDTMSK